MMEVNINSVKMQESFLEPVIVKNEYKVLARKYRPNFFRELIGQDVVVETFKNAIMHDRLHHAFVLTGTRGIGKTTTARIIAKALNCDDLQNGYEPCGKCSSCIAIGADQHQDVLEIDAASHTSVDNMREIIDSVMFRPVSAKYKVYIIDEVHMLSKSAFNALLKTLEEPPSHVKFIFATTEVRKIPITIISRCQKFDLRRIKIDELAKHFAYVCNKENVKAEQKALNAIAIASKGSVRDGLSILDQAISLTSGNVTFAITEEMLGNADSTLIVKLMQNIVEGKLPESLDIVNKLHDQGADSIMILEDLSHLLYSLTRAQIVGNTQNVIEEVESKFCAEYAQKIDLIFMTRAWQVMQKGLHDLAHSAFPEEELEMILIKLHIINTEASLEDLLNQTSANQASNAAHVSNTTEVASKKKIILKAEANIKDEFKWGYVANALQTQAELMLYHYACNKLAFKSASNELLQLVRLADADIQLEKALQQFICKNFPNLRNVEFLTEQGSYLSLKEQKELQDKLAVERLSSDPLVAKILAEHEGAEVKKVVLH